MSSATFVNARNRRLSNANESTASNKMTMNGWLAASRTLRSIFVWVRSAWSRLTTFNLSLSSKNQPLFKQIDNEWMAYSFKDTAQNEGKTIEKWSHLLWKTNREVAVMSMSQATQETITCTMMIPTSEHSCKACIIKRRSRVHQSTIFLPQIHWSWIPRTCDNTCLKGISDCQFI